jgi:ribonuclease T1
MREAIGAMQRESLLRTILALGCMLLSAAAFGHCNIGEVRLADLPPQAWETVGLIQQGGPFPYRKDGAAFGNRERLLPDAKRGYYREFTVPTPGSRDRGARRIVAGGNGELYYTDDHYRSFRRILE